MELLLIDTATVILKDDGFIVSAIIKKCTDPVKLSFTGKIISIDCRYEKFCFVTFYNNNERHVLTLRNCDEPLLDGELMFI
jgi:hypothetical protein